MAQRTITQLIDDIDGGEAVETIGFAVDGRSYEIDLNTENAALLREDFARWVANARRTTTTRRKSSATSAQRKRELVAIREWGRANGWEVSDRGRVPADLLEAYANRHREAS